MLVKRIEQFLVIAVLAGQLCCQGWYFPGISIFPVYLLCLIALTVLSICVLVFQNEGIIAINNGFGPIAVLLIADIALVFLFNGNFAVERFMLIGCSFAFCLACTQAFRTEEEVNCLLKWYLLIVFISSLVEIGQVMELPFCTELWEQLHANSDKITQATDEGRYLGLASDSLQFSYHVSSALAIVFFIRFKRLGFLKKAILFPVFIYALYTNATRSGLLALLVICAFFVFVGKFGGSRTERIWKSIGIVAILLAAIILALAPSELLGGTRFMNSDDGGRMGMFLTAFNHALHYPFGMGAYVVQPDLIVGAEGANRIAVQTNTAHNLLGNCIASYGFIGLALMLGLYAWAFGTFKKKRRIAKDPTIYIIAFCALLGLVINALFHNAYILNGEISSFVFFAILHTKCSNKQIAENEIGEKAL